MLYLSFHMYVACDYCVILWIEKKHYGLVVCLLNKYKEKKNCERKRKRMKSISCDAIHDINRKKWHNDDDDDNDDDDEDEIED